MTIGEKIGRIAASKNINIRKLALESGVSYSTLYSAVTRKSSRISADVLHKVADTLQVPVDTLTKDTGFEEYEPTPAEALLASTINSIVGFSRGEERELKLQYINSFLESNTRFLSSSCEKILDLRRTVDELESCKNPE